MFAIALIGCGHRGDTQGNGDPDASVDASSLEVDSGDACGECVCPTGQYVCATGCCAYAMDDGANGCIYDLDVAATGHDTWSYVTFVASPDQVSTLTDITVRRVVHTSSLVTTDVALYYLSSSQYPNFHAAIDLDASDAPHVAYYEYGQITYVRPDGGKEVVAGSDGNSSAAACASLSAMGPVDLAVDRESGAVHLAFSAINGNGGPAVSSYIVHAERGTTGWACDFRRRCAQDNGLARR